MHSAAQQSGDGVADRRPGVAGVKHEHQAVHGGVAVQQLLNPLPDLDRGLGVHPRAGVGPDQVEILIRTLAVAEEVHEQGRLVGGGGDGIGQRRVDSRAGGHVSEQQVTPARQGRQARSPLGIQQGPVQFSGDVFDEVQHPEPVVASANHQRPTLSHAQVSNARRPVSYRSAYIEEM
jgi:hypothetical protein